LSRIAKYKILLLGEGTVGKTTLKHHYLTGSFTENFTATLGADFATHNFYFEKFETDVTIIIWDIAGQKSQANIRKAFYSHAKGSLLLYDVTNKSSFEYLEENWLLPLEKILQYKPPILLCANKIDLINERVITTEKGKEFVRKIREKGWDVDYLEISAKEGDNVKKSFELLTEKIFLRN
jgi:small GTP-binding protein